LVDVRNHRLLTLLLDSCRLSYCLLDLRRHSSIHGNCGIQYDIRIHDPLAHQIALFSVSRMKSLDSHKLCVREMKLAAEPYQLSVAIRADRAQVRCAEESAKPESSEACCNGPKQDRHCHKQAVCFRMRGSADRDRWTGHISLPNGSR